MVDEYELCVRIKSKKKETNRYFDSKFSIIHISLVEYYYIYHEINKSNKLIRFIRKRNTNHKFYQQYKFYHSSNYH